MGCELRTLSAVHTPRKKELTDDNIQWDIASVVLPTSKKFDIGLFLISYLLRIFRRLYVVFLFLRIIEEKLPFWSEAKIPMYANIKSRLPPIFAS